MRRKRENRGLLDFLAEWEPAGDLELSQLDHAITYGNTAGLAARKALPPLRRLPLYFATWRSNYWVETKPLTLAKRPDVRNHHYGLTVLTNRCTPWAGPSSPSTPSAPMEST